MLGFKAYRHDIGDYMSRWILVLPTGHSLRLHHIARSDADVELHDHPFWFASLILRGSYVEELWTLTGNVRRTLTAGSVNYCGLHTKHRIAYVPPQGTWTLVLTGPRVQSWGFYCADGSFVPWREFMSRSAKDKTYMARYEATNSAVHKQWPA